MNRSLHISLKPGERIYINGAVLKADRKVRLELLNSAVFLLEQHVMKPEETRTPLRQLYFIVQTMLIEPANAERAQGMFRELAGLLIQHCRTQSIIGGLQTCKGLVDDRRLVDALKQLRALFPLEDAIIAAASGPEIEVERNPQPKPELTEELA